MATPMLDDVEISSYNSTTEELEHATSDDWRTALPAKQDTQPATDTAATTQLAATQPLATATPGTAEQKPVTETKDGKQATPGQEQPAKKERPAGWLPRAHLESRLKTEEAARKRAVEDNVRLTQELERLRNGHQPQATQPQVQQPAAVAQAEEGFKPSKPEPQLADFKDAATGNLNYESYDKAWRQWVVQRNDEHAKWLLDNQSKKLPEKIKELTAAEQQDAERAELQKKSNELKVTIQSELHRDPEFEQVLNAPVAPSGEKHHGAMWGALMEVSNPVEVMRWIANNQQAWCEAVGRDENGAYHVTPGRLQQQIYNLSEHLEEEAEKKKNPPTAQATTNGNGAVTTPPAAAATSPQQTTTQPATAPVPMPASSAPAPSASAATRGSARTTARALNDDEAWKNDDDGWIKARQADLARNRMPRGRSRF
jgi:hypothetical protein